MTNLNTEAASEDDKETIKSLSFKTLSLKWISGFSLFGDLSFKEARFFLLKNIKFILATIIIFAFIYMFYCSFELSIKINEQTAIINQ